MWRRKLSVILVPPCRLASYIDRVRQLQEKNAKLTHQIRTVEEYQTREVNNVKDLYDKQVEELKAALDNMNKQYNQLKVRACTQELGGEKGHENGDDSSRLR